MIVYRGTPVKNPLIRKGRHVSKWFCRAASYSRYPNNGPGNEIGYIYELEVAEFDVDWDEREDCPQGKLKKDVTAKRMAVCDIPLDREERRPPIRIKLDSTAVWANGKNVEWVPTYRQK
jgi:hypothetical protein